MRTAIDHDLEPLRTAMATDAQREMGRRLAAAHMKASARRSAAQAEADAVVAKARAEGERLGRATARRETAHAARQARSTVLAAKGTLYREFRDRCAQAVRGLREAPSYPELRARLEARARQVVGADALVRESPDGGVVADLDARRLDLSLPELSERAIQDLGAEVGELWQT